MLHHHSNRLAWGMNPEEQLKIHTNQERPTVLVSIEEVARLLGLGRSTAYGLVMSGELPSVKIGRSRRVRRTAVTAFVTSLEEQV